jgi:hypothetical protein
MRSRNQFLEAVAVSATTHVDRAVALLWYYRQTQEFEERTSGDLARDLQDAGFPTPKVSRLTEDLRRSRFVVRGRRPATFQIDVRQIAALEEKYDSLLNLKRVDVPDAILPASLVAGTRPYLERLVHQINGAYGYGFYDASAVLCRRLVESLIIEVYIAQKRQDEISRDRIFFTLDGLIATIKNDKSVSLGRNTPKTMDEVKALGDTAAHDRTYITAQIDLDDIKGRYRKLISELLVLAGIESKATET